MVSVDYATWRAINAAYLGLAYERLGEAEPARQSFEQATRAWHELLRTAPNPRSWMPLGTASGTVAWLLTRDGPAEARARRIAGLRALLRSLGAEHEAELLAGVAQVMQLTEEAKTQRAARQHAAVRAAAGDAARILRQLLSRPDFHHHTYGQLASLATDEVSVFLRHAGALDEALRLSEDVSRTLQRVAQEAPVEAALLNLLSESWRQVAKARWQMRRPEETLAAYRSALEAQRQAFALAPAEARDRLGRLYADLGRKLCELDRLDEAQACFRQRQALWPGDAAKREDVLRELRKWAAEVGDDKDRLSLEEKHERQRYLDLCARLSATGAAP
jgi:tetratricopeptide (TPR) repeat protein